MRSKYKMRIFRRFIKIKQNININIFLTNKSAMSFIFNQETTTENELNELSVKDLIKLCKQENQKGYSKKNKKQLIEILLNPCSNSNLNRDATKQARGFSYQRQYAMYLFLRALIEFDDITHIIEEGNFNGLVYEDITLLCNDVIKKTYQIKYHTQTMSFVRSNSDLFKTLKNVNNFGLESIEFVVSKNLTNTFNAKLLEWINFSALNKFNAIVKLQETDDVKINSSCREIYRSCYDLYTTYDNVTILNYLSKFKMSEGFTYLELISNINNLISQIFNIDVNDKKIIYYIKHVIFELFDKNWFGDNNPINIDEHKKLIEQSLNMSSNISNFSMLSAIENKINTYILLNPSDDYDLTQLGDNLLIELKEIKEMLIIESNFHDFIKFLNLLHEFYLKYKNRGIKLLYDEIKKKLCEFILIAFKNKNVSKSDYDDFVSSISYYYKHKISNKIVIEKSNIKKYFKDLEPL